MWFELICLSSLRRCLILTNYTFIHYYEYNTFIFLKTKNIEEYYVKLIFLNFSQPNIVFNIEIGLTLV